MTKFADNLIDPFWVCTSLYWDESIRAVYAFNDISTLLVSNYKTFLETWDTTSWGA
jgi:hypothetical protein